MVVDRPSFVMQILLRVKGTGEKPCLTLLSRFGEYGEKGSVVPCHCRTVAFAGNVHYLQVPDLTTASQGYRTGADTAERKSYSF